MTNKHEDKNQWDEEKVEEESTKRWTEDEIAERVFKYSQGCSLIMMLIITILVFLLWFYFS